MIYKILVFLIFFILTLFLLQEINEPTLEIIDEVVLTPPVYVEEKPEPKEDTVIEELLKSHNKYRADKGLQPLILNEKLNKSAQKHAEWMANKGKMSHSGANGSSPFDRMKAEGYNYNSAGENIAYGYADVNDVMDGWMHSSGHRANILGKYKEIGFGIATTENGTIYWATNFGTPAESFWKPRRCFSLFRNYIKI